MNNTRFATVIHILSLLAILPKQWLTSEWIASSIGVNPVIVRKELQALHEQGWVVSKKGKEGGSMLAVDAEHIKLGDLYKMIKNAAVLGKLNAQPNPDCSVGKQINHELDHLFEELYDKVYASLQDQTLAYFIRNFR